MLQELNDLLAAMGPERDKVIEEFLTVFIQDSDAAKRLLRRSADWMGIAETVPQRDPNAALLRFAAFGALSLLHEWAARQAAEINLAAGERG